MAYGRTNDDVIDDQLPGCPGWSLVNLIQWRSSVIGRQCRHPTSERPRRIFSSP